MIVVSVFPLDLFDAFEFMTFVFAEEGTLGAQSFVIVHADDFDRSLMQQAQLNLDLGSALVNESLFSF